MTTEQDFSDNKPTSPQALPNETIAQSNPGTISAPLPKKKQSSSTSGYVVTIIILITLLFLSVSFNGFASLCLIGQWADSDKSEEGIPTYKEKVLLGAKDKKCKDIVAILPVIGEISDKADSSSGYTSPDQVYDVYRYIKKNKDTIKAVILDVDSPGGGVTASDKIYHTLKVLKEETNIPIVALFEDTACSGGYYLSMASDFIVAHPTSFTGSIGVIMTAPELTGLMKNIGVSVNTITSLNDKGKASYKDIGSMFRKMRPEERALLQGVVTQSFDTFVKVVSQGRKGKLNEKQIRALADGRIYTSQQALKHKLIDGIGYREDAVKKAMSLAKLKDAKLIKLEREETLENFMTLLNSNAQVNGNLRILKELDKARFTPGFKYLWTGKSMQN